MKINKHGLKINGLKKASGDTYDYGTYSGEYVEVFYDTKYGDVWTVFQYSLGENSWTQYNDRNVIKICNTHKHITMQRLADLIFEEVEERKRYLQEVC